MHLIRRWPYSIAQSCDAADCASSPGGGLGSKVLQQWADLMQHTHRNIILYQQSLRWHSRLAALDACSNHGH